MQRYLESGSLLGGSLAGEASLAASLRDKTHHLHAAHAARMGMGRGGAGKWGPVASTEGAQFNGGGGAHLWETPAELAVLGKRLESEERLYDVMMMEAAQAEAQYSGGVGAGWLLGSVREDNAAADDEVVLRTTSTAGAAGGGGGVGGRGGGGVEGIHQNGLSGQGAKDDEDEDEQGVSDELAAAMGEPRRGAGRVAGHVAHEPAASMGEARPGAG